MIRAGLESADHGSAAHSLFINDGVIVLIEQGMKDMRALPKDRQAFYTAYKSRHASEGITAIKGIGGKFFRFVHEVKVGDNILYPCRLDMKIYFGVVTGSYFYDSTRKEFPHSRCVSWLTSFPKKELSLYAKRELNTARTFFLLKKNAEEIRRHISTIVKDHK